MQIQSGSPETAPRYLRSCKSTDCGLFVFSGWSFKKRFEILERHLHAFMLKKYKITDIGFKEINHSFISIFEFYLRTEKSCANNTAIQYLKNFGKIIRIFINLKWIDNHPLFGYKLKSKPIERPFLTEDKIQRIAKNRLVNTIS